MSTETTNTRKQATSRSRYDTSRWTFRRKWFVIFGSTGVVVLLGSVAADAFLGTNITANVFDPVCLLLGVNLGSYIWGRNTDTTEQAAPQGGEESS